jgi:uncharacterized membrane protein
MEDKLTFMKKWAVWTAVLSAIAFVFVGIFSPIEAGMSLFGHILKVIFGWAWVTVILETFVYTIGQVAYHWKKDYHDKYGEHWFKEGVKEDWAYIKENVTWKKTLKILGIFVAFFLACGLIFFLLELLVP